MFWTKFAIPGRPRLAVFCVALLIATALSASGQVITSLVGTNSLGAPDGTAALSAPMGPNLVTADTQGNIYFIDQNTLVMKINAQGKISRFVGNGIRGFSGDGGPAIDASVNQPSGIFADAAGNVFLADTANYRIRKIDSKGIITTIAGNGQKGRSPENTVAVNASISSSYSIAKDSAGNIYFADAGNQRIGKIDLQGVLTTFAGTGQSGYSGDGGQAVAARLNSPLSVTVDPSNNVVIADTNNNVLRIVNTSGVIRTFAGTGQPGYTGDNGPATSAQLYQPWTVSADSQGNILFVDYAANVIRRVDTRGIITTVAGNGQVGLGQNNISAVTSPLYYPFSVAAEAAGSFLIADFSNDVIRRVSPAGLINTIAGNGFKALSPSGGAASSAILAAPTKVAIDPSGNLLVADWNNHLIERVNLSSKTIAAIAGIGRATYNGDNIPAAGAALSFPQGITTDRNGIIYISDTFNHRIRRIDANGTITTIAGIGRSGYEGDNGPAASALLNVPQGLRFDASGNLVFADSNNNVIRLITPQGVIRTIAGTGTAGYNRDGIAATQAQLNAPTDVAFDAAGNLYIADSRNHRIRRVAPDNMITTVAGNGVGGFSGDGPGIPAQLFTPAGVNFDTRGNLLIADRDNNRIRRLTPAGQLQTIAGDGQERLSGDGAAATTASLARPEGVVADSAGNIYIADSRNDRIRQILATAASFTTTSGPLTFTASSGGAVTSSQPLSIASPIPGLAFTATASDSWIRVSTTSGSMPVTISVSVDPAQLSQGTTRGRVTIVSPLAAVPSTTVEVVANISAALPPAIAVSTAAVNLSVIRGSGSPEANSRFRVSNTGGGSLNATVTAASAPWVQISPESPQGVTPASPADVAITTSTAGLDAGTYVTQLIVDGGASGSVKVPLTLTIVEARPKILLSQSGLTFTAVAQGAAPLPRSFGILNAGQGTLNWTTSASTLSGSGWLSVGQSSGAVSGSDVSDVSVTVNPAGLAAGDYYGQIQVKATADNSPQTISVVLNVLAAGTKVAPDIQPSGLTFVGAVGSSPGSQGILVGNVTANPITFTSSLTTVPPGGTWLQYAPVSATVNPGQPLRIAVQSSFANLSPGTQNAILTLNFSDGSIRTINISTVVSATGTAATELLGASLGPNSEGTRDAGCAVNTLVVQPTTLTDPSTSLPLLQPANVQVKVVDSCTAPVTSGSVVATFSNGDSQLNLVHTGGGNWSGTWQPRGSAPPQVKITYVAVQVQGITLQGGTAVLTVSVRSGAPTPLALAVANAASGVGARVSPGGLVSIYGQQLAESAGEGTFPFKTTLNGAQVLMGGRALPLRYAGPGQLNAQVPFELATNTDQQLIVQRGNTLSVPQDVVVASAQPAVYTQNSTGSGAGVIVNASKGNQVVTSANPASAGDVLVLYCNGLGAVNPALSTGTSAPPAGPLSHTANPLTVTIGGVNARVDFAGMAPGYPDLYQVNLVVPPGSYNGGDVPVVLTIAGQTSPPVTVAIR